MLSRMPLITSESLPVAGLSEASITVTSRSILNEGTIPSLITPGQVLQPGPSTTFASAQSPQTSKRDNDLVQVSSIKLPSEVPPEAWDPLLALLSPSDHKPHGNHMFSHHYYRGGHERGRGNRMSCPVTRFTEDFDFTAMNEKFIKDEAWGDLGKSSNGEENDSQEDDVGLPKPETKPAYVKDNFFDFYTATLLIADHIRGSLSSFNN